MASIQPQSDQDSTSADKQLALGAQEDRKNTAICGYFLQVGIHGQVGRFELAEPMQLRRNERMFCRTARGLELGRVLAPIRGERKSGDGKVLRKMRPEDELLWGHLQELAAAALSRCQAWLDEHATGEVLLQVEPLMDGRTLYFHFLSEVSATTQQQIDKLAAFYEQEVQASDFAKLLEKGCGPGCGTEAAENGCGASGGCAVCKVAQLCGR